MNHEQYILDTHALIFWVTKENISSQFTTFLDQEAKKGKILISSASFWEIALLTKKGRLQIDDLHQFKDDILRYSHTKMIEPTVSDMIDSTTLPDYHKDPFDRLFIAQAINNNALLVTKDKIILNYPVRTFWM